MHNFLPTDIGAIALLNAALCFVLLLLVTFVYYRFGVGRKPKGAEVAGTFLVSVLCAVAAGALSLFNPAFAAVYYFGPMIAFGHASTLFFSVFLDRSSGHNSHRRASFARIRR
jgi:hypothetical protein